MSFEMEYVLDPQIWTQINLIASFALILGLYFAILVLYRLWLSPIAKFPGPRVAAITGWYETYFDVVKKGRFLYEIEKMHAKYGPIVRINPWELSIKDPEFYSELFVAGSTRRSEKWKPAVTGLGFENAHVSTISPELHRKRRKPLAPFFTRRNIESVEAVIAKKASRLEMRLQSFSGSNKVVQLEHAFAAYAGDIICRICCEHPSDMVDHPTFAPYWYELFRGFVLTSMVFINFPFVKHIVMNLPKSLLLRISPAVVHLRKLEEVARSGIEDAKQAKPDASSGKVTLFQSMITGDMPPAEKLTERLTQEAMVFFAAGSFTVWNNMVAISYYLLESPALKRRLQDELKDIMSEYPERIPHRSELEKIPYLAAVVKEGLRLGMVIGRRHTRMFPDVEVQYKQWTIPRNTPIGMSTYFMHLDPNVYPEPHKFLPERWLGKYNPQMDRNFVPFSKGSRDCLGNNLAYAELYILTAVMSRPGGLNMSLFETHLSDIKPVHHLAGSIPKMDSNGLRIKVQ